MLDDHGLHLSFVDRCDLEGICPGCGEDIDTCRCGLDDDLLAEVDAHSDGCACCADLRAEQDAAFDIAPARTGRPSRPAPFLTASTLRLGHSPRIDERASFIDCGAL